MEKSWKVKLFKQKPLGVFDAIIHRVIEIIQNLSNSFRISTIGIAVPGLVDPERGIVRSPPNFPDWNSVPLKAHLEETFQIPTFINNDVNMFTYGEWRFGAGKGARNLLCITLGTGVGGGIIAEGKLYLGGEKRAGEIGHTILDPDGPSCKCGGKGCLEAFVGAEAIKRRTILLIQESMGSSESRESGSQDSRDSIILREVEGDFERISPEVISQAANQGDPLAIQILKKVGEEIGIALTNAIALLDPERIVIGGGVSKAGEVLFEPIRRTIRERLYTMKTGMVEILPSELGDEAGVLGAAIYAYETLEGFVNTNL
ncbi:ROK family protein [candidate division TA06 bacterium]|nr:ROK family protein [candidate division TA06 bacterium]